MPEFVSSSPPDLESITEAITNAVPDIDAIAQAVPSLEDITNAVPDIAAITNAVPNVADITNAVPSVEDLAQAVPEVEHWSSSPILVAPDAGAAAVSVTSGDDVYGAWYQILSSIGASDAILVGIGVAFPSSSRSNFYIRIGKGGVGSEVPIASIRVGDTPVSLGMYLPLSIPILIPAGSRVSASACASSATSGYGISIHYIVLPL